MNIKIILTLFILVLLLGCSSQNQITPQAVKEFKDDTAVTVAGKINELNLPKADPEVLANTENFLAFAKTVNQLGFIINENTDYQIPLLPESTEAIEKAVKAGDFIIRFAPLLEPYNTVVEKAKFVRADDPDSINTFYFAVGFFVADVVVLEFKLGSKTAIYGADYIFDFVKASKILSDKNRRAFLKYCGSQGEKFLEEEIIPFISNQLKGS